MLHRSILLTTEEFPSLQLFIAVEDVLLLLLEAVVGDYLASPASLASLASLAFTPTSVSASVTLLFLNKMHMLPID